MRILLVNAFHYLRGGVERTYFDESRWLAAAGHEVAHLAIRDPRNLPSPTAAHFAPAADYGADAPLLRQVALLPRAIWSAPAARCAAAVVRAFRPEIAHVHAPSRYLTPSVLRPFERAGVPVVMTLHDFKPWCTNRVLFAHGAPCERCRGGRHWHALTTGCVQGSRAKSAVGMVEAYAHDALGAYRAVRCWIAPSRFVLEKVVELGADRARVRLVPHGVEPGMPTADTAGPALGVGPPAEGRYVLFAGRLSLEKGVRLLPALAARVAPVPLVVAGGGPLERWLADAAALAPNLRLLGHRGAAEVRALVQGAAVVIVPSLFYETYCYAAAEALLDGRPVVASRIGAVPELIEHEVTGLLVPPGDAAALAAAVSRALTDPAAARWAEAGRARMLAAGDPARHVAALTAVYREAMAG
jgi:glycosyltransferase involved in cell wall biosynthesis